MLKNIFLTMILTSGSLFAWFGEDSASISGEAFLKTKGGSIRTCAGNPVYLEKFDTDGILYLTNKLETKNTTLKRHNFLLKEEENLPKYEKLVIQSRKYSVNTKELEANIETIKAELPTAKKMLPTLTKEIEEITNAIKNTSRADIKETICDSQGKFAFQKLKPDTYYIKTTVQWFVANKKQGGDLYKTVILKEGENKIIINE